MRKITIAEFNKQNANYKELRLWNGEVVKKKVRYKKKNSIWAEEETNRLIGEYNKIPLFSRDGNERLEVFRLCAVFRKRTYNEIKDKLNDLKNKGVIK